MEALEVPDGAEVQRNAAQHSEGSNENALAPGDEEARK